MTRTSFLTLLLVPLLVCTIAAQDSFFTHLERIAPTRVVIRGAWDSLSLNKDDSSWEATVQIVKGTDVEEWAAQITARGKYRRRQCSLPPFELNLKKGDLRERGMLSFDKLKVVTHCDLEQPMAEDIMEEFLVYRLYNIITRFSFQVMLVKVDYILPDGRALELDAPALILEPTREVAYRTNGLEKEGYEVTGDSLDAAGYCSNALFQFMIGNSDWSQAMQRNVKMIGSPGAYHCVPYDFDFSAIVAPPYMRIPPDLGIRDYRDRIYLGTYFSEHLPEVIRYFLSKEEEMLAYVKDFPHLKRSRKREILDYLGVFFDYIRTPGSPISRGVVLPYR
jgi:hypothetical protein